MEYDDENMFADLCTVVNRLQEFCRVRGTTLAIAPHRIASALLDYVRLRQVARSHEISEPHTPMHTLIPRGWYPEHEIAWNDWLTAECSLDHWNAEVMEPVFGSSGEQRFWEVSCEGWREEVRLFLPWWMKRSFAILTRFDSAFVTRQANTTATATANANNEMATMKLDPYLLDHGTSKQKKKALHE